MKSFKHVAIAVLLIFMDQLTKYFFESQINPGVSFGLFESSPDSLFIVLFLFIVALLVSGSFSKVFSMVFLAGVLSNLIDRFIFGGVRDWLMIPGFSFSNNFADIWITIGLLGIILVEFRKSNAKRN